ncbi:glycosyltransferase family 2 protein [Cyanobacteria bacterium FACHB-63]|nr:glycosyltransferase family 2 protein [Cyanobacteria bacterium FACHB-63]
MQSLSSSVLIPSFRRPDYLRRCLLSLATQTQLPDEVIVVWQADDTPTRDVVQLLLPSSPYVLRLLHCAEAGIVNAENAALDAATSDIILLCDDDVIVPETWLARHLSFYADPSVGAVGGSANNHHSDAAPFPKRSVKPIGRLTWYGKSHGNMYDHIEAWTNLEPIECDHLVGYNMSLRRCAFDRFESALRPYWQKFELDACLQVKARGYRVLFDFANVVDHYPTNTVYTSGRGGNLQVKIVNGCYNECFILAKFSPANLRFWRLVYLFLFGSVNSPGLLASLRAIQLYGKPYRELKILHTVWTERIAGWKDGLQARELRSEF